MAERWFDTDALETLHKNTAKIRANFREENNIMFPLLDIKETPIELTEQCSNQLLVVYANGSYDVLPRKVAGSCVRDYLQVRYGRIVKWGALPIINSRSFSMVPERDIYYIP